MVQLILQKRHGVSTAKTDLFMLFREIVGVCLKPIRHPCVCKMWDILMLNREMRAERDTEGEAVADKRRPGSGRFILQITPSFAHCPSGVSHRHQGRWVINSPTCQSDPHTGAVIGDRKLTSQ